MGSGPCPDQSEMPLFVSCSLAWPWWSRQDPVRSRRIWFARGLAFLAMAIAGATLLEHIAGIDLGIDQAFYADPVSASSPHPRPVRRQTAIAFIGAALAVLALGRRGRWFDVAQVLGVLCAGVGGVSLLGHLYDDPKSCCPSARQLRCRCRPQSRSVLWAWRSITADPEQSLVRLASDPGPAGQVVRRFLPAALLVVPLGAWLGWLANERGSTTRPWASR